MRNQQRSARTTRRRVQWLAGSIGLLAAMAVGTTAFGQNPASADAAAPVPGEQTVTSTISSSTSAAVSGSPSATASASLSASPSTSASTTPSVGPTHAPSVTPPVITPVVITHRTVQKRAKIPFATRNVNTATLKKGVVKVKHAGRPGVRVTVYRVTLRDGVGVGRTVVRRFVARHPVPRVVLHGTHVDAPKPKAGLSSGSSGNCDSNYSGACVPIASDVDCGGGSGNGPAYVYGTVRVIGSDIYGLDSDGDGYGCE